MESLIVYDAATMSKVPESVAIVAAALGALAAILWLWKRWKGQEGAGFTGWFAAASVIMAAVSVAAHFEKHYIASHADVRQVEGPVVHPTEWRTRRAGKDHDYSRWQGFWIGTVGFSYCRNVGTNYFNNTGPHSVDLREGLLLRVHYIEDRDGDVVQRNIVRVEQLPQ